MRRIIVLIVLLGFCLSGCLLTFTNNRTPGSAAETQQERLDRWEDDPPTPRMFRFDLHGV